MNELEARIGTDDDVRSLTRMVKALESVDDLMDAMDMQLMRSRLQVIIENVASARARRIAAIVDEEVG